jgi:hypothetical protein
MLQARPARLGRLARRVPGALAGLWDRAVAPAQLVLPVQPVLPGLLAHRARPVPAVLPGPPVRRVPLGRLDPLGRLVPRVRVEHQVLPVLPVPVVLPVLPALAGLAEHRVQQGPPARLVPAARQDRPDRQVQTVVTSSTRSESMASQVPATFLPRDLRSQEAARTRASESRMPTSAGR